MKSYSTANAREKKQKVSSLRTQNLLHIVNQIHYKGAGGSCLLRSPKCAHGERLLPAGRGVNEVG